MIRDIIGANYLSYVVVLEDNWDLEGYQTYNIGVFELYSVDAIGSSFNVEIGLEIYLFLINDLIVILIDEDM